ncbi:MAG: PAS domain S-box protein, partial [Candidatus Cloacimonetes bacterium]|nr:PAS domain S-box protein [Candidatus Cloacimonadota bacterium]
MRILIVDDRVENNYLLESLLKTKSYFTISASNGAEALELLESEKFDLIISDILMPVMDGFQLCRKVKTDPKSQKIPFIFYTATYTGPKDEEFALRIGAERFVVKPCEPQEFLRIIEEVIAEDKKTKPPEQKVHLPEEEILKLYSERLVRKLEKKMEQYEEELKARLVAEKTSRANEENLRITLDSIGDAVIATDLQGKITRMNPVAEKLTGWSFVQAEEQPIDKILTIKNARTEIEVENPVNIVLRTGEIVSLSNHSKLTSKSGKEYHIADSAAPIKDKNGKISGVVLVFRDVTENYKIREKLQASESLLNAAGKIAKVGGWELDAQTSKVSWTEETYHLHEVSRDYQPTLQEAIDFFDPEDREKITNAIKIALEKGEAYDLKVRFISAKGKRLWTRTICQPQIEDGKVIKLKGVFQDITESKLAEETLRESEMRYRAIVEAFDGLIYICSQDYRVEFMNEHFIKRTGYDGTGELCFKALHNLETICPWCVNEKVFKGETVKWEVLSPKDNRWYYVVNTPIYHTDGSLSKQSMILDITDRKQSEAELKTQLNLLQIAGKTARFGGWSVDLRDDICTWSDAVADIHEMPHGFSPKLEEAINFYATEWRERITQVFSDCAKKGIPYDEEMEIITNTGKRVWVRTIGRAVKDEKGEIIRVEGSFQDI